MIHRKPVILFVWHSGPVFRCSATVFGFHLLFEPRALWLGVYWNTRNDSPSVEVLDVFVCIVPMLPVRLMFYKDRSRRPR